MAKVIGFDSSLLKHCTCTKCAAIVEYGRGAVRRFGVPSPIVDVIYYIECPNCSDVIITSRKPDLTLS